MPGYGAPEKAEQTSESFEAEALDVVVGAPVPMAGLDFSFAALVAASKAHELGFDGLSRALIGLAYNDVHVRE